VSSVNDDYFGTPKSESTMSIPETDDDHFDFAASRAFPEVFQGTHEVRKGKIFQLPIEGASLEDLL